MCKFNFCELFPQQSVTKHTHNSRVLTAYLWKGRVSESQRETDFIVSKRHKMDLLELKITAYFYNVGLAASVLRNNRFQTSRNKKKYETPCYTFNFVISFHISKRFLF